MGLSINQPTNEGMGTALREAREKAGKSQAQAAEVLGVSRVAISNYERGQLPEDFVSSKLRKLAPFYGIKPHDVITAALLQSNRFATPESECIPENEPIEKHIAKFPVSVQVWFLAFLSQLLALGMREDIDRRAIDRAREQITFAQLDMWAGGGLLAQDGRRTLRALKWCAEASWRSVTEPGWLTRPREKWMPLPAIFATVGEDQSASSAKPSPAAGQGAPDSAASTS